MTSSTVSEALVSATITLDGARHEQIEGNGIGVAIGRIEEVDGDEASTKAETTTFWSRNMQPRCSELLIVIVTAISTLLLTLMVQAYLKIDADINISILCSYCLQREFQSAISNQINVYRTDHFLKLRAVWRRAL